MTKKDVKARKAAWNLAISRGLVVRYEVPGFQSQAQLIHTCYATIEARDAAIAVATAAGVIATIVNPELAEGV